MMDLWIVFCLTFLLIGFIVFLQIRKEDRGDEPRKEEKMKKKYKKLVREATLDELKKTIIGFVKRSKNRRGLAMACIQFGELLMRRIE